MMHASNDPAPRHFVNEPVELRPERTPRQIFAESRNLSETGMLVVSEDPRPPGTVLRFKFYQFGGWAEVVWRRQSEEGPLLGLRFVEMSPEDRAQLRRLLSRSGPY